MSCLDQAESRRGAWISDGVASGWSGSHGEAHAEQLISGIPAFSSADCTLGSKGRSTGPSGGVAGAGAGASKSVFRLLSEMLVLLNFDVILDSIVCVLDVGRWTCDVGRLRTRLKVSK